MSKRKQEVLDNHAREEFCNQVNRAARALQGGYDDRGIEDDVRNCQEALDRVCRALAMIGGLEIVPFAELDRETFAKYRVPEETK